MVFCIELEGRGRYHDRSSNVLQSKDSGEFPEIKDLGHFLQKVVDGPGRNDAAVGYFTSFCLGRFRDFHENIVVFAKIYFRNIKESGNVTLQASASLLY